MKIQLARRQFLRAGSAILALPWLEGMAAAADAAPPRRMVAINTEFGLYGPAFFLSQAGAACEWSS